MELSKVLTCMAVGVGAVAAAPFTGGGSIFGAATLAEALTVGGAIVGGTVGATAGAVMSAMDEDNRHEEIENAQAGGSRQE